MNMIDEKFRLACAQLRNWCMQSRGEPIDLSSGVKAAFRQVLTYSESDILGFSDLYRIELPSAYRYFLLEVGSCECFMDQYKLGIIFHPLASLSEVSEEIFQKDGEDIFPNLLLVASLTGRGDYAGFNMRTSCDDNFTVFSHEDDSNRWIEDAIRWTQFEEWIMKLVDTEGEKDLPSKRKVN
jgi:hypothetical protein